MDSVTRTKKDGFSTPHPISVNALPTAVALETRTTSETIIHVQKLVILRLDQVRYTSSSQIEWSFFELDLLINLTNFRQVYNSQRKASLELGYSQSDTALRAFAT